MFFSRRTYWIPFALTMIAMAGEVHADPSKLAPEIGYDAGQIEDARWAAFGGASRAVGGGTEAVWGNPATLTQAQVYHVGGLANFWPQAQRQSYGAAAMDSVTSRLALGIGYAWSRQDPAGLDRTYSTLRAAAAFPFSNMFSVGVTGNYLKLRQEGLGPLGPSLVSGGLADKPIVDQFTFDAGLRMQASKNFSIGLLGRNLTNPDTQFQPLLFGGGIAGGSDAFVIEGDLEGDFSTWDKTKMRAMAGAELLLANTFPIRVGYRYDQGQLSHAISGGLGYTSKAFAATFAARQIVSGPASTTLVFTLEYFVESTGATKAPRPSY